MLKFSEILDELRKVCVVIGLILCIVTGSILFFQEITGAKSQWVHSTPNYLGYRPVITVTDDHGNQLFYNIFSGHVMQIITRNSDTIHLYHEPMALPDFIGIPDSSKDKIADDTHFLLTDPNVFLLNTFCQRNVPVLNNLQHHKHYTMKNFITNQF